MPEDISEVMPEATLPEDISEAEQDNEFSEASIVWNGYKHAEVPTSGPLDKLLRGGGGPGAEAVDETAGLANEEEEKVSDCIRSAASSAAIAKGRVPSIKLSSKRYQVAAAGNEGRGCIAGSPCWSRVKAEPWQLNSRGQEE